MSMRGLLLRSNPSTFVEISAASGCCLLIQVLRELVAGYRASYAFRILMASIPLLR